MSRMERVVVGDRAEWKEVISSDPPTRPEKTTPKTAEKAPEKKSVSQDSAGEVTKSVQRDYIHSESSILTGTLVMREPNTRLKSKANVNLQGLGSTLSGLYYIEKVIYRFDNRGISQELELSRKGFGDSMKKKVVQVPKPSSSETVRTIERPKVIPKVVKPVPVKKPLIRKPLLEDEPM